MKRSLISGLMAIALLLSACQNDSDPTSPTTATPSNQYSSALTLLSQLDLSKSQIALVDEMYYMDEDLSLILNDGQFVTFDLMAEGLGDTKDCSFPGSRNRIVDVDALMYFRLIVQACDHTDEELQAIRDLIAASNATRSDLIKNATDKDALVVALQAEHESLINAINALIGQDCVDAVEALKAEIQAKRDAIRAEMEARRIQAELDKLTEVLSLTDAQVDLVKALIEARHEDVADLREQYKDDPEGLRAALAALMEQFKLDMLDILDDTQDALFEEYLTNPGHGPGRGHHRGPKGRR